MAKVPQGYTTLPKVGDRIRICSAIRNGDTILQAGQTGVVIRAWVGCDTVYASGPRGRAYRTTVVLDGETRERDIAPCYYQKV